MPRNERENSLSKNKYCYTTPAEELFLKGNLIFETKIESPLEMEHVCDNKGVQLPNLLWSVRHSIQIH